MTSILYSRSIPVLHLIPPVSAGLVWLNARLACPRLPFCQLYLLFHSYIAADSCVHEPCPFTRMNARAHAPWFARVLDGMDVIIFANTSRKKQLFSEKFGFPVVDFSDILRWRIYFDGLLYKNTFILLGNIQYYFILLYVLNICLHL